MSRALYTGSFDPLTNGHLDVIERAAGLFDTLTVGVIVNPNKKTLFTKEERAELVRGAVAHIPNVEVDCFQGLLADYVNREGFQVVVRGLRATTDFEYEMQMAQMNQMLFQEKVESVFLMTDPRYSFISSSMIKEVASLGGSVKGLIPETVLRELTKRFQTHQ